MAIKLPADFKNTTRKKLTETASGDFFKQNNPKLVPSFDRGVVSDNGEVIGDGKFVAVLHRLDFCLKNPF